MNKIIDISNPSDISELLFEVVEAPVRSIINNVHVVNPDLKQIVGVDSDGSLFPISVVGSKFAAFPYAEVFEAMQEAIASDAPGATLVRAGVLDHGGRFFATYRLPEDISPLGGQDATYPEITLRSALNGKWKNSIAFGSFRMICENGIVSFDLKELLLGFKRTRNASLRIPEVGKAVEQALAGGTTYREQMARLVELVLSPDEMQAIAAGYFANSAGISTKAFNVAQAIVDLAFNSPGVAGKNAYDLLNGFTNFFSHPQGESEKSPEKWFDTHNFGSGSKHKAQFAQALLSDHKALIEKGRAAISRMD